MGAAKNTLITLLWKLKLELEHQKNTMYQLIDPMIRVRPGEILTYKFN
jgi:hypothetical protein